MLELLFNSDSSKLSAIWLRLAGNSCKSRIRHQMVPGSWVEGALCLKEMHFIFWRKCIHFLTRLTSQVYDQSFLQMTENDDWPVQKSFPSWPMMVMWYNRKALVGWSGWTMVKTEWWDHDEQCRNQPKKDRLTFYIKDNGDDDGLDDAYPLQPSNCLFPLDRSCFFLPANRCMAAAPWDFCQLDPEQETRFRKVPPRVIEAPGCWLNILLVHVPALAGSKKVLLFTSRQHWEPQRD